MRHAGVKLVAGAVQVGGDQVGETLPVLGSIHLGVDQMSLLGDAVWSIGLFRIAIPQTGLVKWHRGEFRIGAHGAHQRRFLHRCAMAGRLDDVRSHQQVVEIQRRRSSLVVSNTANSGGEMNHVIRLMILEHL